jgi:hypothetical protein
MTVQTIPDLKNLFVTGAKPSEQDFIDLIDTLSGTGGAISSGTPVYGTAAALRAAGTPGAGDSENAITLGAGAIGDGGGGRWYWDDTATAGDDTGFYLLPSGHVGDGRWVRIVDGFLTPQMFGVESDAVWNTSAWTGTDQTSKIQACDDAAYSLGVPVFWPVGYYYIAGTIQKNPGVNWYGTISSSVQNADARGVNLCPSTGSTSKTGTSQKWSNSVLEIDFANTGGAAADVVITGINILGFDESQNSLTNQNGRCGLSIVNQNNVRFYGTVRGMAIGVSILGGQAHRIEGAVIFCGDDSSTLYAMDLRLDARASGGSGGSGYSGNFGDTVIETSFRYCDLSLLVSVQAESELIFQNVLFTEDSIFLPSGSTRTNNPIRIEAASAIVIFQGCTFETVETTNGTHYIQVNNSGTIFRGCNFIGEAEMLSHTSEGLKISDCIATGLDPEKVAFVLGGVVEVKGLSVTHNLTGVTSRKCFQIQGNFVRIDVSFYGSGTPGTLDIDEALIEILQISGTADWPLNGTIRISIDNAGSGPEYGRLVKSANTTVLALWHVVSDFQTNYIAVPADWGTGKEMESTGSGDVEIWHKRRNATMYTLVPTADIDFDGFNEGTIKETVVLFNGASAGSGFDINVSDAFGNYTLFTSPDTIAPQEYKVFRCTGTDAWIEIY